VSCPFYGKHADAHATNMIVEQHGNECAILVASYSPCLLDIVGISPNASDCALLKAASMVYHQISTPTGPVLDRIVREIEKRRK
jgi:hypothetical protein